MLSTEPSANPESVLHGHKLDKIGSGGLKHSERRVDLVDLRNRKEADWSAFLRRIKDEWLNRLTATAEGSAERDQMYQELAGPREKFKSGPPAE